MMQKQTIQLGEYFAAYTSVGQGKPIIFLHGFFGDSSTLKILIEEFQNNYRCISLDLLGFGESSKPNINYLIKDQVDFLRQFVKAIEVEDFYLIGYSYGGWVAAAYGILEGQSLPLIASGNTGSITQARNSLRRLVLIAPAGIRDDKFVGRYSHLKPLLWDNSLVDISLFIISAIAKLLGKDQKIQFIYQVRRSLMKQPAAKAMLKRRLQIREKLKKENALDTVETELDTISIPTLIVAGERDKIIPLFHAQTYAKNLPNAALEIIENADHNLIQTHGKKIGQLINQYWKNEKY